MIVLVFTYYKLIFSILSLKDFGYVVGGAILIALFFQFLILITKGRGMGDADVKLGFLIGLVNGFPMAFMAVFMGYVLGAFYSVFLMLMKKKTMKDSIPFGPFLILGSVLILLFGNQIWLWYSGLGSLF
jgi:leader peptidase (prepilin peptidase)/N-methyltransferase